MGVKSVSTHNGLDQHLLGIYLYDLLSSFTAPSSGYITAGDVYLRVLVGDMCCGTAKGRVRGVEEAHIDDGAPGGDANEAGQGSVGGADQVPHDVAGGDVLKGHQEEECREGAAGGGEGRVDRGDGHHIAGADDGERRARVEAVPAEPEDEDSEDCEGGVVAGDGLGLHSGRGCRAGCACGCKRCPGGWNAAGAHGALGPHRCGCKRCPGGQVHFMHAGAPEAGMQRKHRIREGGVPCHQHQSGRCEVQSQRHQRGQRVHRSCGQHRSPQNR